MGSPETPAALVQPGIVKMTIDLTTTKVGTKFRTRNAGIAVFEGKNPAACSKYPYNDFCWTLLKPPQVIACAKFCTDSTGTYCRVTQDRRDIIAEISPSVDLSNCKFGDLVRLRNGQYAVVLVPRTSNNPWVCIGMKNGDTTHILRNSGHWYNDSSESPQDVVEILSSHPLAPKDYEASVTVFQKITGTRDDAQEFINRQKAKWEPREGTMVCTIKEL
jgi:hypothetical protein